MQRKTKNKQMQEKYMNVARHLKIEMHYKSQGDGAQRA
jgi:hypothetical protein